MTTGDHAGAPLTGVRVLDASTSPAGAAAAMHLADFGADVVRIESGTDSPAGSAEWLTWNRGKRIVRVDDGDRDDRIRSIVDRADLTVVDAPPAELGRRGLQYADLCEHNRSVHLWMPPTGVTGEWSELPADRILLAAVTAVASHQGEPDGPVEFAAPIVESIHGLLGACGAIAALIGRQRGCDGARHVVVSGLHAVAALQTVMVIDAAQVVRAPSGPDGGLPNFRPYRCGDGSWIYLAALSQPFFLQALDALGALDVMVLPGIDGEFTKLFDRENARRASQKLADRFTTRSATEWIDTLRSAGVPVAPVQSRHDWAISDSVRDNKLFTELTDPTYGTVRMPPIAARLSDTPGAAKDRGQVIAATDVGWDRRPTSGAQLQPRKESHMMPLAGLRVLDLGAFVASPFAGSIMCDLGADVIKVEPPDGDDYRVYGASFVALHQGKLGTQMDLKTVDGQQRLANLVSGADVVIHNFRVAARKRVGLEADTLRQINDRVIVCELDAWGEHGELRNDPAFDPLLQARSGLMEAQGDSVSPSQVKLPIHDTGAATMLALGGLAALFARQRTGRGQRVSTSMVASSLVLQPDAFTITENATRPTQAAGPRSVRGFFECWNGWIGIAARSTEERTALLAALDLGELANDDSTASPELVAERMREHDRDGLARRLRSVGVPAAPVLPAHDEYADEFLVANGFMHTVHDPTVGPCTVMRHYASFPGIDHERGPSPRLGHGDATVPTSSR